MKRLQKSALFAASALILAGQLYAQPSAPDVSPPTAPTAAQHREQISPEEMKKEAQTLRNDVRADIQHLYALQARARKAQDVIKLTCVNDKFVKLKAQANLFDDAHRNLLVVIDGDDRYAAYDRVTATAADVHKVREEADVCIGEPELSAESANDFSGPEIIDDPTLGLPFDIEVEPPAYASPYI